MKNFHINNVKVFKSNQRFFVTSFKISQWDKDLEKTQMKRCEDAAFSFCAKLQLNSLINSFQELIIEKQNN